VNPNNKKRIKSLIGRKGFFRLLKGEYQTSNSFVLLWRGVLDKALADYLDPQDRERENIDYWLSLNNQDFKSVCAYSALEPEFVIKYFNTILIFSS
jgi:hypothetical protein